MNELLVTITPTPKIEVTIQPAPVIELVMQVGQGVAGPRGEQGEPGNSAFVNGAGVRIVGTEIRLSIGTLPQL